MGGNQTYVGRIITPPETGETNSGKQYCKFSISAQTKAGKGTSKAGSNRASEHSGTIINCVCWAEFTDGKFSELEIGRDLTIRGFYGKAKNQMDAFEVVGETKEFVVKWFKLKGEEPDAIQAEIRAAGGEERYREYEENYRKSQEQAGFVRVQVNGIRVWRKKEDCIFYQGKWQEWVDVAYDLCPKEKREQLNLSFRNSIKLDTALDGVGGFLNKSTDGSFKKFKDLKASLIARAKELIAEKEGQPSLERKIDELNL